MKISRQAYADMYGPPTVGGDRVRLGDTELWIEVEEDLTHYGDEVKFGGGKVIRDGMGQSQRCDDAVMDTVITNASSSTGGGASSKPTWASRKAASPPSAKPATRTPSRM